MLLGLAGSNSTELISIFEATVPTALPEKDIVPFKKDSGINSENFESSTDTSSRYKLPTPSTKPLIGPSQIKSVIFIFCAVAPAFVSCEVRPPLLISTIIFSLIALRDFHVLLLDRYYHRLLHLQQQD